MCKQEEEECVENVKKIKFDSQCLSKCSGVLVTSFDKQDVPPGYQHMIRNEIDQYKRYKGYIKMPPEIAGITLQQDFALSLNLFLL